MNNKKELQEIRDTLKEIVVKLNKMLPEDETEEEYADWYIRRMNILADILEAGGSVSKEQFHKLVKKNGMDTRGVGGFFIKSNPSLTTFEDVKGPKVALTKKGKDNAQKWLDEKKT